jgi:hypothetical protein
MQAHWRSQGPSGDRTQKKRDDRAVAVPQHSFFAVDLPDVRNLPATATKQLEKFFDAINALKSKKLEFLGWRGPGHQAHKSVSSTAGSKSTSIAHLLTSQIKQRWSDWTTATLAHIAYRDMAIDTSPGSTAS